MELCPKAIPARLCDCSITVTDKHDKLARDGGLKNNSCILCQPPKSEVHLENDVKRKLRDVIKHVKETQKRINMLTINAASVSGSQNRGCVSEYMEFLSKLYGP